MKALQVSLIAFSFSFLCFPMTARPQSAQQSANSPNLALLVQHFELHHGTLLEGIAMLTRQSINFSFGVEQEIRERVADAEVPQKYFDLTLDNSTVSSILDALCRADGRYQWETTQMTVNLYPRTIVGDTSYLLNRTSVHPFIQSAVGPIDATVQVLKSLPGPIEKLGFIQIGGEARYLKPWTTTLDTLTVRQALNVTALHITTRTGWLMSGSKEFPVVSFFSGQLSIPEMAAGTHK